MTFIRFNKCNKACSFCDTNFSCALHHYDANLLSQERILFTGGEPFLFHQTIKTLIKNMKDKKFFGETNGSLYEDFIAKNVTWAISPKNKEDVFNCEKLLKANENSYLKLVFGSEDFDFIFSYFYKKNKNRICIQPLTKGSHFLNLQECVNFCATYNIMVSPRLHILYGMN